MSSNQGTIGRLASSITEKRLERKKKMMKLNLRQRLRNWLLNDPDEESNQFDHYASDKSDTDDLQIDHESAFHFSVIPASGGKIVKVGYYDRVKDRNVSKLHIITPDEKLEEAIAHIFQIEVLSR